MKKAIITTPFRKSSYSHGDHSECVEVAHTTTGGRAVRDSKDPARGTAYFGAEAWGEFISGLRGRPVPQ
ncbi:DUF397 domain-containing protein [Streptomyces sp. CA-250714]|uniref:DUF397 domain-containing protein n=1 Tax=Streptomyces sp. CA-250714 TaxID=3240060 RepID=UPI003D92BC97